MTVPVRIPSMSKINLFENYQYLIGSLGTVNYFYKEYLRETVIAYLWLLLIIQSHITVPTNDYYHQKMYDLKNGIMKICLLSIYLSPLGRLAVLRSWVYLTRCL